MPIYIGPPGNLQALPYMGRGMAAPLDLGSAVHRALGGARTVDYVGDPKRTYSLERRYLSQDELGLLEGLALGLYGAGPYALLDPFRRNLLTENQSAAGDYSHDTTGFTVLAGSVTVAGPVAASQGTYWAQYLSPASGAAGTAGLLAGNGTVTTVGNATPVQASTSYTFQAMTKTVAGTAASWRASIKWYDSTGALLSTSDGTAAVVTGSFVARTVTATSPSTAAYAVPGITNNATLVATNTIAVDALMLAQATAAGTWVPGTGVPRVAFVDTLALSYPGIVGDNDLSVQLQEVA